MSRLPRILPLLALVIGLGFVAARLTDFDPDPLTLFPEDMPEVEGLRHFQRHFGRDIDVIVSLEGEDADGVEAAAEGLCARLRAAAGLVRRADWELPGVDDPAEYGELAGWVWMQGAPARLEALAARLAAGESTKVFEASVAALVSGLAPDEVYRAGLDPLGLADTGDSELGGVRVATRAGSPIRFASDDGRWRVLFVDAPGELYDYEAMMPWLRRFHAEVAEWQDAETEAGALRLEFTGRAPYIAEIAGAMRAEMLWSVVLTMAVIVGLFWLAYRCVIPLLFLVLCLALTVLGTLVLGALVYDRLGASAVGFAAILIGLVVDYGFIVYQETRAAGARSHREAAPGILWAALTTAAVFAGLNLSGLPGASQLGTLVAMGVVAGAAVMLTVYPRLLRMTSPASPAQRKRAVAPRRQPPSRTATTLALTVAAIGLAAVPLGVTGLPGISTSAEALRPRHSHALEIFEGLRDRLASTDGERVPVVVAAPTIPALRAALVRADEAMRPFAARGFEFSTPLSLVPDAEAQRANRQRLEVLVREFPRLRAEADAAGLSADALEFAEAVFASWGSFLAVPGGTFLLPSSPTSRWVIEKVLALDGTPPCALASLALPADARESDIEEVLDALRAAGATPAGWEHLRPAILRLMKREMSRVLAPIACILAAMLFLAFRELRGVILSLACVALGGAGLLAFMALAGIEWNLINLAGIPLLLGAALDYSIHMQLALRRSGGDRSAVWRGTGRALVLCGLSTATGFGTLAFSGNAGAASLGLVCAAGIVASMLVAVGLLPLWWSAWRPHRPSGRIPG